RADAPASPGRERYERGTLRYNLGDFDAAIVEFKAAYEASRAPALLYNLAQAHRLNRDPERALYFYRTYLREAPDAENRAEAVAATVLDVVGAATAGVGALLVTVGYLEDERARRARLAVARGGLGLSWSF